MTKNIFIWIIILLVLSAATWIFARKFNSAKVSASITPQTTASSSPTTSEEFPMDRVSGQEIQVGTGQEAKTGDTVNVHYSGYLIDGKKFDSSIDRGQPFTFTIGSGEVIQGWDIGVASMRVGGKRRLIIPPSFGYGSKDVGNGLIPPNSVLIFDIELLSIKK